MLRSARGPLYTSPSLMCVPHLEAQRDSIVEEMHRYNGGDVSSEVGNLLSACSVEQQAQIKSMD
ncbi:20303_t:CDS:2 [Dentiscutata erythropus]|uniref:20303_t:CDS:1 n=1 Tax=Dentiscutata erythropus TaxID=1348616 RepID=A0A9N8WNV1_9GLOM|nr:20303_t:CDS:2 [Dentiscutata erythropus]